jgi:hypothetical protein
MGTRRGSGGRRRLPRSRTDSGDLSYFVHKGQELLSGGWANTFASGTLVGLVVAPGTHFGWPLRLAQASIAVAAGATFAFTLRRSVHAVWVVPLAVVLVRLRLDPVSFEWHWLEVEALAIVGAGLVLKELPNRLPASRLGRALDPQH